MKRIAAIAFVVVLALAVMGTGYARWAETLTVHGVVNTGEVDWYFHHCRVSDPPGTDDWTVDTLNPAEPDDDKTTPRPMEPAKDVGSMTCEGEDTDGDGDTDTIHITLNNVYPSYWGSVSVYPKNNGTIPIHYVRMNVGGNWVTSNQYLRLDLDGVGGPDIEILTGDSYGTQLHPDDPPLEISFDVHVLQTATEGVTGTFDILLEAAQYNEPNPS